MPDRSPSNPQEDAVVLPAVNDAVQSPETSPAPTAAMEPAEPMGPMEAVGPVGPKEPMERPVAAEAPPVACATIRLEKKHPLAIRWMHWINFPVLFTMIWSGLLIYWGDSDNAYQHPHRVYRIGIGSWTLFRFFPEWVYRWLHAPFQITTGLGWHFVFMWIFAINGLAYVTYLAVSGNWRLMVPRPGTWGATLR